MSTLAALNTVLTTLALHLLGATNNDMAAARHAASAMLADYNAETAEELHLAAAIISFGFQTLDALAEAASPGATPTHKIRLRGSAVSLSREAHKARRKLDQLQRARRSAADPPKVQAPARQPSPAMALPRAETLPSIAAAPAQSWPISRQQRRAAERAAAKDQRRSAEQARREALRTRTLANTAAQVMPACQA